MGRTRDDEKFEKRKLRVVFTEEELAACSKKLAKNIGKEEDLYEEKKTVVADFNAKIKEVNEVVRKLADDVRQGSEERDVKCQWKLDTPKAGLKVLVRLDTGEVVEQKSMELFDGIDKSEDGEGE